MARIAGVVAPGLPHHVTQPGNGRLKEFPLGGDPRKRSRGYDVMRGQADPWEMAVLLESLKRHWVVSCNGKSQDEKGGISRNKYDVPPIQFPGVD